MYSDQVNNTLYMLNHLNGLSDSYGYCREKNFRYHGET